MKILLIRHGEALHNVHPELWSYDNEDMFSLTRNGVIQALELGQGLAAYAPDMSPVQVEHSPSIRTVQTAAIIAKELKRVGLSAIVHSNDTIREIGTAYHPDFVYNDFADDPYYRKDNGESFHQRFTQYKERGCIRYPVKGCTSLVVSHLHAMNAIIAFELYRTGQVSEEEALKFHRMQLPHCVPLELTGVFDVCQFLGWQLGKNLLRYIPTDIRWDDRHEAIQQYSSSRGALV